MLTNKGSERIQRKYDEERSEKKDESTKKKEKKKTDRKIRQRSSGSKELSGNKKDQADKQINQNGNSERQTI